MPLELAGEDEFVTVAIDLAGNRYARMIAEPRLRRHASGADMMRFLRAYAEHETNRTTLRLPFSRRP